MLPLGIAPRLYVPVNDPSFGILATKIFVCADWLTTVVNPQTYTDPSLSAHRLSKETENPEGLLKDRCHWRTPEELYFMTYTVLLDVAPTYRLLS